MKKIITLITAFAVTASAMAQVTFGKPHAIKPKGFTTQSVSLGYDTSLLKGVLFFDKLDSSYAAVNYDVGQVDGLFHNPLRLGVAAARGNGSDAWTGPSLSYELVGGRKFTFGLVAAFPGLRYEGGRIFLSSNQRVVPGVFASVKF